MRKWPRWRGTWGESIASLFRPTARSSSAAERTTRAGAKSSCGVARGPDARDVLAVDLLQPRLRVVGRLAVDRQLAGVGVTDAQLPDLDALRSRLFAARRERPVARFRLWPK